MDNSILKRFVLGFEGNAVTPFLRRKIKDGLFGVILFERNFHSIRELKSLCRELHAICPDVIIAIDQEGGDKSRLRDKFPNHPNNRTMATKYSAKTIEEAYYLSATGLSEIGIDWNFAPVVDIGADDSYIKDRSFSSKPQEVAQFASYAIRGIQKAGLFSCAKHFVGLGGSKIDPHKSLPRYNGRLTPHLLPFLSAAIAGVDAIMSTHIICSEISEKPVTVCEKAISILRSNEARDRRISIGFKRIIITDDILMGGSTEWGVPEEVSLEALAIGHDISLICHEEAVQEKAIYLFSKALEKSNHLKKEHIASLVRLREMVG